MNKRIRIGAVLILVAVGCGLLLVRSDRQFINLQPTPGVPYAVPLKSGHIYTQQFVVHHTPISQIGVYLRPLGTNIPDASIHVRVLQHNTLIHEQTISALFADPETASQVRLPQPMVVIPPETLRFEVTVPPVLSGRVALQTRMQDETFNGDATFFIDSQAQAHPLAYQVDASVHPSLTLQLGGLLLFAALWILLGARLEDRLGWIVYAIGIAVAANVPLFVSGDSSILLLATQAVLVFVVLAYTQRMRFSRAAQLIAAHTVAFTTWWPLVLVFSHTGFGITSPVAGNFIETLFDPNQLGASSTGAYVGLFATVLAVLGLSWWKNSDVRRLRWIGILFFGIGIFTSPILIVIAIAMLSAVGLHVALQFLGSNSRLVRLLLYAVTYIALIDTFTVYARLWYRL